MLLFQFWSLVLTNQFSHSLLLSFFLLCQLILSQHPNSTFLFTRHSLLSIKLMRKIDSLVTLVTLSLFLPFFSFYFLHLSLLSFSPFLAHIIHMFLLFLLLRQNSVWVSHVSTMNRASIGRNFPTVILRKGSVAVLKIIIHFLVLQEDLNVS